MARRRNPVQLYNPHAHQIVWEGELDEFLGSDPHAFTQEEIDYIEMLSQPEISSVYFVSDDMVMELRPCGDDAATFRGAVAVDDSVVVVEGVAIRIDNPGRKRNACAKGEILIDRKGYKRRGYKRKDGTRVKPTVVPAASFCIPDPGRPGRGARGAEKGPYRKEKPWIEATGSLGGPGFTKKSAKARHQILDRCVKKDGYRSCLGKIMVLLRDTELKADTRKKLKADKKYLVDKYGGPGSFGPRERQGNLAPDRRSRRRQLYTVEQTDSGWAIMPPDSDTPGWNMPWGDAMDILRKHKRAGHMVRISDEAQKLRDAERTGNPERMKRLANRLANGG